MFHLSKQYAAAGVDIHAGYEVVRRIKPLAKATHTDGVLSGIGSFGGLFCPDISGMKEPVLVSGTDGIGTKLLVANLYGKLNTIGIDAVAMCVNDIACAGAKPLFFLDYLAVGKNNPDQIESIISGIAEGCKMAGCALIGGETAEMPGLYAIGDFDVAGFSVGIADKSALIDGSKIKAGDAIVGIASSGVHTNGFSLIRKVFGIGDGNAALLNETVAELGCKLGDELLKPTKIYVSPLLSLIAECDVRGVSNITGGGFFENIPRMLPQGLCASIDAKSFPRHAIFDVMRKTGGIDELEMYNVFNMGIGMAVVVPAEQTDKAVAALKSEGENAFIIGEITQNDTQQIAIEL